MSVWDRGLDGASGSPPQKGTACHDQQKCGIGFGVNPLHNVVHILVGALLIGGGLASIAISKRVNITVGAVYFLVFAIGIALQGSTRTFSP